MSTEEWIAVGGLVVGLLCALIAMQSLRYRKEFDNRKELSDIRERLSRVEGQMQHMVVTYSTLENHVSSLSGMVSSMMNSRGER